MSAKTPLLNPYYRLHGWTSFLETPSFCRVSCEKIENGRLLGPLRGRFLNPKSLQKPSSWGPAPVFTQTPWWSEKPKNILTPPGWPYLGFAKKLTEKGIFARRRARCPRDTRLSRGLQKLYVIFSCLPLFRGFQRGVFVSATGGIRFRGVRFQTPHSVSFLGLTEFWAASSVSSSQPIIYVPKRTHRVFRGTHRVCPATQWVLFAETVLSKQYSARFLIPKRPPEGCL